MASDFEYNVSAVVKCQNCGADMVYDPEKGALHCAYCDATRTIDKKVCTKRAYDEASLEEGEVKVDDATYKCPNCGAEIKLAPFDTALKCPYCGGTNVVKLEDMKGLKPDSILPFALSQNQAAAAGKKWIKKKIFAPIKLKKSFKVENFKGVYIPSYAFSANADSTYDGRLGERRTRTVGSGKDRHIETYIEWYKVKGSTNNRFDDMAVEASTQLNQKEMNKILPYDTDNLEAYNKDYIAGFSAEKYDTSLEDGFGIAKGQMDDAIRKRIINSYGADVVDYLNVHTSYSDTAFRYMMLPLWVCAYMYRKKGYRFIINGRTGKSTGKSPVSPLKVIFTVLVALGLIVLAVWLYLNGYLDFE